MENTMAGYQTEEPSSSAFYDEATKASEESPYTEVTNLLAWYLTWTVMGLGVPCNLLSFFTMVSAPMRGQSTSLYLACLALSDTLCLVVIAMLFTHRYEPSCHTLGMLLTGSMTCSGLIILLISTERLVAVWFPLKVGIWMTRKRAWVFLMIAFVLSHTLYIPRVLFTSQDGQCDPVGIYENVYFIQLLLFYACGPILILIIFNTAIIARLNMRTAILHDDSGQSGKSLEVRKVTLLAVTVATTYILLTLPSTFLMVYGKVTNKSLTSDPGLDVMIIGIMQHLIMINHAINFWLYVIISAKFRRALQKMFRRFCFRGLGSCTKTSGSSDELSGSGGTEVTTQ